MAQRFTDKKRGVGQKMASASLAHPLRISPWDAEHRPPRYGAFHDGARVRRSRSTGPPVEECAVTLHIFKTSQAAKRERTDCGGMWVSVVN